MLDDIIDGATTDAVSTSNLLRKVQVVAHRLNADDIKAWAQRELMGYENVADLPRYRAELVVNVLGVWAGPMGHRETHTLSAGTIAEDAARVLFRANLTQPIAELEDIAAATGDADPSIPWDPIHVGQYNRWGQEGKVPRFEFMGLLSANRVITRAMIRGVIDSARNTALDFALSLQSADPTAGAVGGPTVADAPVERAVMNITNNIYGDGAQVAQGENFRQRSKVVKGDLSSLLKAAEAAGLAPEGSEALARAVLSGGGERNGKVQAFLAKVREGAFLVGTGVAAEVLADRLAVLISTYLS